MTRPRRQNTDLLEVTIPIVLAMLVFLFEACCFNVHTFGVLLKWVVLLAIPLAVGVSSFLGIRRLIRKQHAGNPPPPAQSKIAKK